MKLRKKKAKQSVASSATTDDEVLGILDVEETVLDKQSAEQPGFVWRWNRRLGQATRDLDYAELELKITLAEVDVDVRGNPESYKLDKFTEAGAKTAVYRSKRFRAASVAVIEARKKLNDVRAVCQALEHRRTSLSHFVQLREQSYFSRPRQESGKPGWEKRQRTKRRAAT